MIVAQYVRVFVTLWTVVREAPLSMDFPGKNTGVGSHSLLQGIFPNQESNLGLLHCRQILYRLSDQGSPVQRVAPTNRNFLELIGLYRMDPLESMGEGRPGRICLLEIQIPGPS